jgi:hypothetical protein
MLRPIHQFVLQQFSLQRGTTWYRLETVMPRSLFPGEELNAVKLLNELQEMGLVMLEPNPKPGVVPTHYLTEAGHKLRAGLDYHP